MRNKQLKKKNNNKYFSTPLYGVIPNNSKQFSDLEIFNNALAWKYVQLKKITIKLGTPKINTKENIQFPIMLGMQCVYYNSSTGEIKSTEHSAELLSDDIEIKNLELSDGDYFTKINMSINKYIFYFKIKTKKGKILEIGKLQEEYNKTINYKDENFMIQSFFGYYDNIGIRSLGCKYVNKKVHVFTSLLDLFRLRHIFKTNKNEKEKWSKSLNKLNKRMKAVAKVCLLPDNQFTCVIQFCL